MHSVGCPATGSCSRPSPDRFLARRRLSGCPPPQGGPTSHSTVCTAAHRCVGDSWLGAAGVQFAWVLRPARKVRMPNWNWSSVEIRASRGASWTVVGELAGGEGGEEGPHAADELVAGLGVGAGAWDLQGDEPQDVGQQGIDGADHGLVGETGRPQDTIDGLAQAQAMRAEAGLLEGVGHHGGVGEQVGPDGLAEGGQLLGPVTGGVRLQVQVGVDLVDEPVDQIRLAADAVVEGVGRHAQAVGQAAHGQSPGALLFEQGQGFFDDLFAGQRAPRPCPDGIAGHGPSSLP